MRLRTLLIALGALLALGVIAAVAFVATFDANRYKPELVDLVREGTGRALSIDGELSLALLPRFGLSVGPARLSGPDGRGEFAQFDSARIGVAFWPLLSRRVVIDRVMLDGLKLEGVRRRDGTTNLDDLLRAGGAAKDARPASAEHPGGAAGPPDAAGAAAAAVTIAGLQLRNATIGWRDEAAGTEWRLLQADLETGRLASGEPGSARLSGRLIGKRPLVDVVIELSTGYLVDFATRTTRLSDFDLKARGRAPAAPALDARLRGNAEADPASGRFDLADVVLTARSGDGVDVMLDAPALAVSEGGASGQPIRARVRVDRDGRKIDATVSVSAPTRSKDLIVFGDVKAEATVAGAQQPADGIALSLAGDASVDPKGETATLAVRGRADGSALQAKLTATRFAPLALRYELQADRVDLDRYRAAPAGPAAAAPVTGGAAPDGSGGTDDSARPGDSQAGAIVAPAALAGVDTDGSVRIGTLKVAGIDASNVVATIASGNGRVDFKRLTATIFRGTLDASATLGEAGRHALRLQLTGADAGMALRELAGRDVLDGRGNLSLDVTGDGRTLAALERSLDGTAALALRDGALKGVDLAEVLRRVRQAMAAARGGGSAIERSTDGDDTTAFSSLDASFVIRDGVARNDDLDLRSPLLRVSGSGRIDLPQRSVDYLARVSVVGTLAGQGGTELAALRGVTVPVELKGPFTAMSYRVDVAGLAIDTAKQALTRKLQEKLLGKPDAGAKEPSKPISPRDLLEGLLRR
jgi:AsmA protein